ncbi:beta-1,4-N-acetylgalactosaminyltransferase bre-4-like [Epargyreus clarus]|uniref:beta-1,4-N-acetylgalactosaminyltransferase bre-4-like n=1 Tax=Epargyreus clarus TaxID=520877 RepID=UPI003C2E68D7
MPKWLPINKLFQIRITTCVASILCLIALIQFFASYGQYNYSHLPREHIYNNLYINVNPHLVVKKSIPECKYEEVLQSTKSLSSWEVPKVSDKFSVKDLMNGSYAPETCNPLFSVAILVTYRNRQSQLDVFLPYIHNFLRKQNIHYKIFLVEQQDNKAWNKGMLYNIGVKYAIAEKFPCLILHDVDLLPLDEGNLYACLKQPRHISASIDKFRYVLTYKSLVGGVLAIRADQYVELNGFSNRFTGWGGEDDDFAARIAAHKLDILRFPPELSRYTMIVHPQEAKNTQRHNIMDENKKGMNKDGYDSVEYATVSVKTHRLFTMIGVKL